MGAGENVGTIDSLATGETLTIRPASGNEWIIHNLYYEGTADIYVVNADKSIKIEENLEGPGALCIYWFHLTNNFYMRIVNVDGASKNAGYDGIISK